MSEEEKATETKTPLPVVGVEPIVLSDFDFLEDMRTYEIDHEPDGWPAVPMASISRLIRMIDRLWRPIETAPKDGTIIDLFNGAVRVPNCKFNVQRNVWIWAHDGTKTGLEHPTHWMPLPEPPIV